MAGRDGPGEDCVQPVVIEDADERLIQGQGAPGERAHRDRDAGPTGLRHARSFRQSPRGGKRLKRMI